MAWRPSAILPKHLFAAIRREKPVARVAEIVVEVAGLAVDRVYERLATTAGGLTESEAARRLSEVGPNVIAKDARPSVLRLCAHAVMNPLVILLAVLATVSFATDDRRAATVMGAMIVLSVGLKLVQESKADQAAAGSRR